MKIHSQRGFNLVELMIAMAIIAILISVSVYSWQIMVRRGNEAAALGHIKKISIAQAYYASKHGGSFAVNFEELVANKLLSKEFSGNEPVVDGYRYLMVTEGQPPGSYLLNADPASEKGLGATGVSRFYFDSESDTVRVTEDARSAGKDDPSV